ncbi:hypothetical protein CYMTET_14921 [Cymbomonas tetramitiformis]|uniref:Glycosyl hydrolase family 30 beta sandwich domain-containing protein n=1 Tax=Cymbomonas tetramitiformis TaxID=36881 RepID=A0AAE0GFF3_9CHLO|nr:hypothetical protein CYMTET_14921 [Cymbomonas tetramitiformis]
MWLSLWYPSDGYCLFEGVGDSSAAGSIYVQYLGAFSPAGGLVIDSHVMGCWHLVVNGDGHWSALDDGMWLSLWYPSDGYCLLEGVGDSSAARSLGVSWIRLTLAPSPCTVLMVITHAGGLAFFDFDMKYWRIAVNGDGRRVEGVGRTVRWGIAGGHDQTVGWCGDAVRTENQLWTYNSSDFTLRTAMHDKWCLTAGDRALLTVAGFNTDPLSDHVAVVVLNRGDVDTPFSLFDPKAGLGVTDLLIPAHSIQTYRFSKTQENVRVTSVAQPPPPWNVSPSEDPPFVTMTRVIVACFFGMLVVASAVYVMGAKLQDGDAPTAVRMERLPRAASRGEVDDEASAGFVLEDEESPSRDSDVRMQMLVNGAVESSSGSMKQPTRPSGKNC